MLYNQKIEGVIFDCDGVLVDSESLSCYALNIVFENQFGIDIGNDYSEVLGTSVTYALEHFLKKNNIAEYDLTTLIEEKEVAFFELASKNLKSFENCERLIKMLLEKSIKIAVASSGTHNKIEFSLNKVNLLKYFNLRCSSTDVERGKPAPDLFMHTAKQLDLNPSNCLVIEDSIHGVIAGVEAGMKVIAFPGSFTEDQLTNAGGYFVRDGYREIINILF